MQKRTATTWRKNTTSPLNYGAKTLKMKTIKLKPLAQKALYAQFYWILGGNYNWDISRLDLESVKGHVLDKKTGQLYKLATEEEEEAYKARKKRILQAWKIRLSKKYDNHPTPIIDYKNHERFTEGLKVAKEDMSKAVEMCADSFWHFLECVPPRIQTGNAYVCGEPYTHSKGEAVYLCATHRGKKYFAQYGTVKQFNNKELFKSIR